MKHNCSDEIALFVFDRLLQSLRTTHIALSHDHNYRYDCVVDKVLNHMSVYQYWPGQIISFKYCRGGRGSGPGGPPPGSHAPGGYNKGNLTQYPKSCPCLVNHGTFFVRKECTKGLCVIMSSHPIQSQLSFGCNFPFGIRIYFLKSNGAGFLWIRKGFGDILRNMIWTFFLPEQYLA